MSALTTQLLIGSPSAPLGVVGFVFEGRPNVFADAAGVLRSGNTVVFRIGSDALGTAQATAMIFLVLLGADMLNTALAVSQMPVELATWVKNSGLSPLLVMLMILIIYVLLGCVMDSLAMILLTIPVFYPIVKTLGFDLIWSTEQMRVILSKTAHTHQTVQ